MDHTQGGSSTHATTLVWFARLNTRSTFRICSRLRVSLSWVVGCYEASHGADFVSYEHSVVVTCFFDTKLVLVVCLDGEIIWVRKQLEKLERNYEFSKPNFSILTQLGWRQVTSMRMTFSHLLKAQRSTLPLMIGSWSISGERGHLGICMGLDCSC